MITARSLPVTTISNTVDFGMNIMIRKMNIKAGNMYE